MKIFNVTSNPKISPLAPEWNYYFVEDFITTVDFELLSKFILDLEKDIKSKNFPSSSDGGTYVGHDSLTGKFQYYNVLSYDNPQVVKLKKSILNLHDSFIEHIKLPRIPLLIQCWANVLRRGQDIKPHIHSTNSCCYLGGHIAVQCSTSNPTSTVYINPLDQIDEEKKYFSKNEVGKITLFQNFIPHYTTVHEDDKERITIAFDIVPRYLPNGVPIEYAQPNKYIPFN